MPTDKTTATIATLSVQLDGAISQISELKGRFDAFQAGFVRQDLYNLRHEELTRQVTVNTNEISHLQRVRWIMPTVTMVIGGVLVFLINYALTH